ncbi:MAG: terminase TerL endonuclease subunit [Saccharofermentanales bacterium]
MKQNTNNNPILLYNAMIQSGDIIACKKIEAIFRILADRVINGYKNFRYCPERGNHIIDFFEKYLKHSKGSLRGQRVQLEIHQKAKFAAAFGFVDKNGYRQFQRVVNIVAKKNGKSFESSGVGLYGLLADGEGGAEIYSVATKRDQAKIIWNEAKSMRNQSKPLRDRTRVTVSGIYCDALDGKFEPQASDSNTLDGLNIHMGLMDEFHQWRNGKSLYLIIADGISSRDQPMLWMTSTAGTVRNDIYDEIYEEMNLLLKKMEDQLEEIDDTTLAIIYELDSRDEWKNPKMWIKANPNLGVSKKISYLENKIKQARINPKTIKNMLTKEFNVPETEESSWLEYKDINNRTTYEFVKDGLLITIRDKDKNPIRKYKRPIPDYAIGGFDLSIRGDLTAAVIIWQYNGDPNLYVMPMFWMPQDVVEAHIKSDNQPYDVWIENGHIRVCPGNQNDYKMVHAWFEEVRSNWDIYMFRIGYDPYQSGYLVDDMANSFGETCMQKVRQGAITLGMPMATIEKMFQAHRVIYNDNPVLKYNLMVTSVTEDRNGNMMPIKKKKHTQRVDGTFALLDAWTIMQRDYESYMSLTQEVEDEDN